MLVFLIIFYPYWILKNLQKWLDSKAMETYNLSILDFKFNLFKIRFANISLIIYPYWILNQYQVIENLRRDSL